MNLKTLAIFGTLLLFVMGAEAAVIYMMLPDNGPAMAAEGDVDHDEALNELIGEDEAVEVPIDSFKCSNNRVAPGSVVHISFKLTALVSVDQEIAFNEAANKSNRTRVKQAVEKVLRSSTMEDLNDPALSTIKRLIREEINKVLRKSYVNEAIISDFQTIEQ